MFIHSVWHASLWKGQLIPPIYPLSSLLGNAMLWNVTLYQRLQNLKKLHHAKDYAPPHIIVILMALRTLIVFLMSSGLRHIHRREAGCVLMVLPKWWMPEECMQYTIHHAILWVTWLTWLGCREPNDEVLSWGFWDRLWIRQQHRWVVVLFKPCWKQNAFCLDTLGGFGIALGPGSDIFMWPFWVQLPFNSQVWE